MLMLVHMHCACCYRTVRLGLPIHFKCMFQDKAVDKVYSILDNMTTYTLTDTDRALLSALVVTAPNRKGLTDSTSVGQINKIVYAALELSVTQNRPDTPQLLPLLLKDYEDLLALGEELRQILPWFGARWQLMRLPPLFSEIFDMPKHSS